MANPIGQILAAFTSLVIVLIAFSIFDPMLNQVFNTMVLDNLNTGGLAATNSLFTNLAALDLTRTLVLIFFKILWWLLIFAIFSRLFIWFGFYTEEQGYA